MGKGSEVVVEVDVAKEVDVVVENVGRVRSKEAGGRVPRPAKFENSFVTPPGMLLGFSCKIP